jgi:hypothetical protein
MMSTPDEQHSEMTVKLSPARRGFWPNLAAGVRTPSVSLVLIVWLASVVSLCVWGSEKFTPAGLGALSFFLAAYVVALGQPR